MELNYSTHYYDKLSSTKHEEGEKSYQQKALERLVDSSNFILSRNDYDRNKLLLKGPTGSGKTVVSGAYIDTLFNNYNQIVAIWLCARPKLAEQSRKSVSSLGIKTASLEEVVSEDYIPNHTAVFGNWEKISSRNKEKKLTRDTETTLSFENLVKETKRKDIKVVLIIDEAHKNTDTRITNDIIKNINPDLILDITATPKNTNSYFDVIEMKTEDVVRSGVIKKGIKINDNPMISPDIRNYVLTESLNTLLELEDLVNKAHKELGFSWYQPLLLIQIPNNSQEVLDQVEAFYAGKGLTRDNGKLAVYTSKDYTDELDVISNDQNVKILIFKQAIAEGWDCPRASVLTFIRDPKTHSFTIQTIGRIMRMVDRKHYPEPFSKLNFSYIYAENDTNTILNKINEDFEDNMYITVSMKDFDEVEKSNIQLFNLSKSYWKQKGEIKAIKLLPKILELNWKEILNLNPHISWSIVHGSVEAKEFDEEEIKLDQTTLTEDNLSERDLKTLQSRLISEIGLDKTIVKEIEGQLEELSNRQKLIIMCDKENLMRIKHQYEILKKQELSRLNNEAITSKWDIPEEVTISNDTPLHEEYQDKYLYKKCYLNDNSLELNLAQKVNESGNVIYWLKNQDNGSDAFTVAYKVNNEYRLFYVDFLIETEDKIIIIDTKGSHLLDKLETQEKNKYLQGFISEMQDKVSKELVGGIVKEEGNVLYLYQGDNLLEEYSDLSKWSVLTL